MMFPGAQYIGYVAIFLLWVVISWSVSAAFSLLIWIIAPKLIARTQTDKDRKMGKKPPKFSKRENQLVWPWWSEAKNWVQVIFWPACAVFGYTFAGPAFYLAQKL